MSRLDTGFVRRQAEGVKTLVVYLTAGDPDLDTSVLAALAAVEAGADVIEIGVPFSDPVADGPVIQRAMARALEAGGGLEGALEMARRIRAKSSVPLVLFGYLNPLLSVGLETVCDLAAKAGIDGLLVVDLPLEESEQLRNTAASRGLDWVALVAPTSGTRRARRIAGTAGGFVYLVSMVGVTGGALSDVDHLEPIVSEIRAAAQIPVCVGFGVRDGATAEQAAMVSDGVVVGSAVVSAMESASDTEGRIRAVRSIVAELKRGVDAARGLPLGL